MPGVLSAIYIERGMRFALGSTLAFHRCTLERIGGLQPLADYLADDYELGHRTAAAGFNVELADCVVDHYLPAYSMAAFFRHQLRWARTLRGARPDGYAALILTFAIPWTVLGIFAAWGAAWSWILFSLAVVLRLSVAFIVGGLVLRDRQVWRNFWLLPIRDFVALPIWVASYMGRQIVWRGKKFELANGKLRSA
jgi:ceramide glucosyltransferase